MNKLEFRANEKIELKKAVLNKLPFLSSYQFSKILKEKDIKVNNKRVKENCKLDVGDYVEVFYQIQEKPWHETIFEDDNLIIVNKKAGIEVISETDRDLYSILKLTYPNLKVIHRIDRNTEGLVVFAKNDMAETELLKAFKERTISKKYLLECHGKVNVEKIKPKLYLKKLPELSKVLIAECKTSGYDEIRTNFKFISFNGENSLLEAELITGKTHQIRAHISYYGHYIIGDGKYGKGEGKMHLTAYFIKFKLKENNPLAYLNSMHFEIMPSWINPEN